MKESIRRREARIQGVLSCFDLMLFRGYLPIVSGWSMAQFLKAQGVNNATLKPFLMENAERVKAHAIALAKKHERPYQYLTTSVRKEDAARSLAERDGIEHGRVCVFSVLEPCRTFSFRFTAHSRFVQRARRKCSHLYVYFMDRDFGPMHVHVQSWFALQIHIYSNGSVARSQMRSAINVECGCDKLLQQRCALRSSSIAVHADERAHTYFTCSRTRCCAASGQRRETRRAPRRADFSAASRKVSMHTRAVHSILFAAAAVCAAHPAFASDAYPAKPVRYIVPFPPGGATDVVTRLVAQKLNDQYRRQVAVVDNRAGAGGVVGSELAATAAPDGYTLVMGTTGTHAINASLYAKPSYHPIRDFVAVTPTALLPNMIVVHPSVPIRNVREMIALARARPGQLSYASSGNFLYLSGALFTSMAKVEMLHVPFKGGAQAMPAVMSGEVASSFATIVSSLPLVASGRLRGLAVTSAKRFPTAKEFPTVAESGLPGYEAVAWYGVFAPAGTPRDIVGRLNADIVKIINSPEVRELLLKQGAEAYALSPAEFAQVVARDVEKWAKVVKVSGATPN